MEPTDLTVRLQDIRDEVRGMHQEQRVFAQATAARFEVIESALRDVTEQIVILGRGVEVASLEKRAT